MMRFACLLALIALAVLILLAVDLNGATATAFSFIGAPSLGLAVLIYVVHRWRSGAFSATDRNTQTPPVERSRPMSKTTAAMTIALLIAGTGAWAADGAALFKGQCAKCHGNDGKADTPAGKAMKVPALAGDANVAKMSDADVEAKIKNNPKHASFAKSLTDDDLKAAAAYVKQLAAGK